MYHLGRSVSRLRPSLRGCARARFPRRCVLSHLPGKPPPLPWPSTCTQSPESLCPAVPGPVPRRPRSDHRSSASLPRRRRPRCRSRRWRSSRSCKAQPPQPRSAAMPPRGPPSRPFAPPSAAPRSPPRLRFRHSPARPVRRLPGSGTPARHRSPPRSRRPPAALVSSAPSSPTRSPPPQPRAPPARRGRRPRSQRRPPAHRADLAAPERACASTRSRSRLRPRASAERAAVITARRRRR